MVAVLSGLGNYPEPRCEPLDSQVKVGLAGLRLKAPGGE